MKITQDYLDGARQIIQKGLGLQPGQNLLIIADATTFHVASFRPPGDQHDLFGVKAGQLFAAGGTGIFLCLTGPC